MILANSIKPTESSGIEKKSKGEIDEEAVVSEIKEITKDEMVDAASHHHKKEWSPYAGIAEGLGNLRHFGS